MKKLLFLLPILIALSARSQLNVTLGAIKTDLKKNAIDVGITYAKSLDSIWKSKEHSYVGHNKVFSINPEINVHTGNEDAFSLINFKVTGLLISFKDTTIHGLRTPNTARGFQTFPVSLGAETNNLFNTMAFIVEAGWVPWYQTSKKLRTSFIRRTKFGVFIQSGYKFDSTGRRGTGGQVDESAEAPNSVILRTKGSFAIDTKKLVSVGGLNMGLVGTADGWYDIMNGKFYYAVGGIARVYLSDDKFFDAKWQSGAGAPTFNTGKQYGVSLSIVF